MTHHDCDAQVSLFSRLDINYSTWKIGWGPHDRRRRVRVITLMRGESLMTVLSDDTCSGERRCDRNCYPGPVLGAHIGCEATNVPAEPEHEYTD